MGFLLRGGDCDLDCESRGCVRAMFTLRPPRLRGLAIPGFTSSAAGRASVRVCDRVCTCVRPSCIMCAEDAQRVLLLLANNGMQRIYVEYVRSDYDGMMGVAAIKRRGRAKPFLVLDLDETLLHTEHDDKCTSHAEGVLRCCARPFYEKFLNEMERHFKLFVFTHGEKKYAANVCKLLDITPRFVHEAHMYTRESAPINPDTQELQKRFSVMFCSTCRERAIALDDRPE
eukprot:3646548-Rhodomonas_salina.1